MRSLSDVELVRAAKAGSGSGSESGAGPAMSATQELLRRHGDRLFRIVSLRFPSRSIAEDIVQETFLRAMAEVSGLREEQSFFAWLAAFHPDWTRRAKEALAGAVPREAPEEPSSPSTFKIRQAVHRALTALDEDTRELIVPPLLGWALGGGAGGDSGRRGTGGAQAARARARRSSSGACVVLESLMDHDCITHLLARALDSAASRPRIFERMTRADPELRRRRAGWQRFECARWAPP